MKRFHQHKAEGVGGYRRLALLLIAAIIGGLLQPLFPAQTAAAQRISQPAGGPSATLKEPAVSPSSASAPAATVAQQANLVNVALGKLATQSNENALVNSPYLNGFARLAVDGNTDGWYYNGSVTHTWGAANDWWQVDLGGRYPVERIDLWNRTDCCAERLNNFYVFVSDVPFVSDSLTDIQAQAGVDGYFSAGVAGATTSVTVGRSARYVRVVLSQPGLVSLAEVQVWSSQADPLDIPDGATNVAQGKTANQINTYNTAVASRAVDGNTNGNYQGGSVTHTLNSPAGAWWEVDLGGSYPIEQIDLWNRTDCCTDRLNDFYVFVSDTPFTITDTAQLSRKAGVSTFYTRGAAGLRTSLAMNATGRYVRVALGNAGLISLAEVQVWSKQRSPIDQPARAPQLIAGVGDRTINLFWYPVPGAASYRIERAATPGGPYTTLAANHTTTIPGTSILSFSDTGRTNEVFVYYRATALDAAGQQVNYSEETKVKATVATVFDAFQPIAATDHTAMAGLNSVQDGVLNRPVMTGFESGDYLAFANVNFSSAPNGLSLSYSLSKPVAGSFQLVAQPAGVVVATVPVTGTNGTWSSATALSAAVTGAQTVYMSFAGQGGENLRLDRFQFSKPGPFDTATVKWDPNIVLLHKSMGIALDNYALDQADMTMLMRFSTTTAQGRTQFALLKAGSLIASDTNLDLGGPYARVQQVVSLSDTQVAVKAAAIPFNELIYAGGFDASAAIQQSVNAAMDAAVGTSAKGPAFSAAGYDTTFPTDITYYDSPDLTGGKGASGSQSFRQNRTAGMGAQTAQSSTPGAPTVLPPEAKNAPKGTFHVTMDNAQFVKDENGWGVELVNVKMNGLGIAPLSPTPPPGSNPTAAQFGFGVLGGVGADKLMIQAKVEVDKGVITRNEMFSVKTQVTGTARFQAKGLAVALWFWELPLKWIKPIRFVVPTAVGPIPCSIGFGVQGFIMAVGAGNMVAERGYQVKLTHGGPPGKEVQVSDYGETKIEFGQRADNVSLFGLFLEPYVKLRVGTFGLEEADPALLQQLLGWMGHWVKITPEQLKKMEGFFVFTFTPRVYYMMLLQNWKDKERPIHEQKFCVGPIVKAEALPGFPLPMTFELRLEGPPYCFWHETWLQYDMQVPEGVLAEPGTGKAKVKWGAPVISERSRIPYQIKFANGFPYSEPGAPEVLSTNIADGWFNAAQRRRCLIFRKPLSQLDPVEIAYNGPCKAEMTTEVQLPGDRTEGTYMLRVLTEYRHPTEASDTDMIRNEYVTNGALPWGIWSDKAFVVVRPNDTTTFKVNATEVFSNSAQTMDPIQGTECDPQGQRALGMTLEAQLAVVDPTRTTIEDVTLQVDGADVAVSYLESSTTRWQLKTQPLNLFSGAHTMTIAAKEKSLVSGEVFTVRYSATFKAQAKPCGRAKPDDMKALVFEGSRCAQQESPEIALDVLANDDWTGEAKLTITAVGAARLGTVRIGNSGQTLRYKPKAVGVDSFAYTVAITTSQGLESATANVLVTNKQASTDAECAGGGGSGGGSGGGNPGKSGKIKNWGDPHVTTADGKVFDSHALGEFVYLQPRAGQTGITVHGRQQPYIAGKFPAITTALAFRIGARTVEFRAAKNPYLLVDGVAPTANIIDLGDGASLAVGSPTSRITVGATTIEVTNQGGYLDSLVTLPLDNRLEGMWGSPNDNQADDWRLPTGALAADPLALAEGWRITDRTKSLFTYASGEGPETYNQPNVYLGQMPSAEALAPYVQQARDLLGNTCTNTVAPDEDKIKAVALELYIGTSASKLAAQLCSYELSGAITSANPAGAPVVGALVSLSSPQTQPCSTYTDLQGRYRCQLAPLPGAAVPSVTITVAGTAAQTYTFPAKAPNGGTLTQTLNLVVTRPSIRLALRSVDDAGVAVPNALVELKSGTFIQRITTGADGTAAATLTYEPGTTSAPVQISTISPFESKGFYQNVTLNPTAPVDLPAQITVLKLDQPRWTVTGNRTTAQYAMPIVSNSSAAIAANGTIYTFGTVEGIAGSRVLAFSPTGVRQWFSPVAVSPNDYSAPVLGPDGTIYAFGLSYPERFLYAFAPNGTLKWSVTLPRSTSYSVSTSKNVAIGADGTIYLVVTQSGASTSELYALNPATGAVRWNTSFAESAPQTSPAVGPDGTIYVAGANLRAFNPDGTLKAVSSVATGSRTNILLGPNGLIYLVAGLRLDDGGPYTIALNPDLTQRWRQSVGNFRGAAVGTDGALYLTTNNALLKLDPATGTTVWSVSANIQAVPTIAADGTVYTQIAIPETTGVPSTGQVIGVNPDGTVRSRFKLRSGYPHALVMGADGTIYTNVYTYDGGSSIYNLVAVPTGSTSGPAAGWSSLYGNPQNTGRRAP